MHRNSGAIAIGIAIAMASGSACAMSPAGKTVACRVVDGAKLPQGSGGAGALCRAVEAAAARQVPAAAFAVEVRVVSRSALVAAVRMTDGRKLPELNLAVSDAPLNARAIQRFAAAIAGQAAGAAKR